MAVQTSRPDGTRLITEHFGLRAGLLHHEPLQYLRQPHIHADVELNFLIAGAMAYDIAGREWQVTARRMVAFWAGLPHGLCRVEEGSQFVWVSVPISWFLHWDLPPALRERILAGELLTDPSPGQEMYDDLQYVRWAREFESGSPDLVAVALEVQARIRRLGGALLSTAPTRPKERRLGRPLERAIEYASTHYTDSLTAGAIANAAGLHPKYLSRAFRTTFGMSLWEYVTRLRISHAQRLLLATDGNVAEVSLASGFPSLSRFYKAFQEVTGVTPGAFRRSASADRWRSEHRIWRPA